MQYYEESVEEKRRRWKSESDAHRAATSAAFADWKRRNPNAGDKVVEQVQRALALW